MQAIAASPMPKHAALRVFGATSVLFAVLIGVLFLVRPDMMMAAMHSVMHLMP